ncbi:MAG: hypothetical protein WKF47_09420 [Geodermatophilaceae bacterium]
MAVAWDRPQTRADWRSYRDAGLRWLAAALVCAVLTLGGVLVALHGPQPGQPQRIPFLGLTIVLFTVGAAGTLPIGLGVLARASAWRNALQREPWRQAELRIRGLSLALTPTGGEPIRARLLTTTRWRVQTLQALDEHELSMVAVGRTVVLSASGADTLYGARRTG